MYRLLLIVVRFENLHQMLKKMEFSAYTEIKRFCQAENSAGRRPG